MKKFLLFLIAALTFAVAAQAQSTGKRTISAKDTNTNATTTYVTYAGVGEKVKSFQVAVTKISGTVAGTCLLQGTVDGTNWVDVNTDTLTLANQTTNTKVWIISATSYYSYRLKFTTTGTQVSSAIFTIMRRPEE